MIKYIITFIFFSITIFGQSNFHEAQIKMVNNQIEARGIEQPNVLDAFLNVERHQFVAGNYVSRAYSDSPLPIGYGQTISQPYIVAFMTEVIKPDSSDVVLEIGTGSGYQAAILAEIVKEVYTIEIITELAEQSKERLSALGYSNVEVKNADGYYGWEEHAPFDAIVVTAAAEYIPPPLIEQLKDGGKMIIPVGSPFLTQRLMLVEKENGETKTTSLLPVRFVPFTRGN
ncbi:MAG: protein-L-isoaspartate(D-aspartate) O-methyltransferase [Melioribacteraceae bacterium]|nr:protein-L-isoaspartate(D-aspartate) O-methyltransferase [Melioribacteraceae bacterium]